MISDQFSQKIFKNCINMTENNIFISCSSNLKLRYVTVADKGPEFKGFNAYYEGEF